MGRGFCAFAEKRKKGREKRKKVVDKGGGKWYINQAVRDAAVGSFGNRWRWKKGLDKADERQYNSGCSPGSAGVSPDGLKRGPDAGERQAGERKKIPERT